MAKKIAVLFSGGKDSTLTAFITQSMGFEPLLVSFVPRKKHSYMLHGENIHVAKYVAKAMGLPHVSFEVSGEKENEVKEMLDGLKKLKVDGLAAGAIESEYQKTRVEWIAENLDIPTYNWLWHKRYIPDYTWMDIILVKASAEGITARDLGKPYRYCYSEGIHPYLEGGEGETLVVDAPFFKYRLDVCGDVRWYGDWGEFRVTSVHLIPKLIFKDSLGFKKHGGYRSGFL